MYARERNWVSASRIEQTKINGKNNPTKMYKAFPAEK